MEKIDKACGERQSMMWQCGTQILKLVIARVYSHVPWYRVSHREGELIHIEVMVWMTNKVMRSNMN